MKIFPLKILSPLDRAKILMSVMTDYASCAEHAGGAKVQAECPDYDKNVDILGSKFTLRDLRSIYKTGLQRLSHDKFELKNNK